MNIENKNEEFLIIKLEYKKPIEFYSFLRSFLALNKKVNYYLAYEQNIQYGESEIYLESIKEGSILITLGQKILGVVFKKLIFKSFAFYLKEEIDALFEDKLEEFYKKKYKKDLTTNDMRTLLDFFKGFSNDLKSEYHIGTQVSNITNTYLSLTGKDAAAGVHTIEKKLEKQKPISNEYKNEVLYWEQASNAEKSAQVDKGIIDNISLKPVKIISSNNIKAEMIHDNKKNPFKMFYLVDVEVRTIQGEPVLYIIKKILDKGEREA